MRKVSYRRHRFPADIVQHAVWLYFRFPLSYRDVEDLLAERGIDLTYETVRRWALKFGLAYARCRQSEANPSPLISLINREKQGIFSKTAQSDLKFAGNMLLLLNSFCKFPKQRNREFFQPNREFSRNNRETHLWIRERFNSFARVKPRARNHRNLRARILAPLSKHRVRPFNAVA